MSSPALPCLQAQVLCTLQRIPAAQQGLTHCCPAGEPNNDSPLNVSAAKLWDNQAEYRATLLRKAADQGSS